MSEALCTFVSSLPSNQNTSHARRLSDGLARAISLLCRAFFHEPGHVDGGREGVGGRVSEEKLSHLLRSFGLLIVIYRRSGLLV